MAKRRNIVELSETLSLSEDNGFWLWDDTRGMNLSVRAKTPQDALVEGIMYYQERLGQIEQEYRDMSQKVDAFVEHFREVNDDRL